MYFTELRLINFGLYPGEHAIDLRPPTGDGATDRPITLIGGKNGAGKTTILEAQFAELHARRVALDAEFAQAHTELAHLTSRIGQVGAQIEAAEGQFASQGGSVVERRAQLNEQESSLKNHVERYKRMIAEHAAGLLPFAIIPQLSGQLRARLELDERVEQYIQVSSAADHFVDLLRQRLDYDPNWPGELQLGLQERNAVARRIKQLAREVRVEMVHAEDLDLDSETVVHPLEKDERRQLIDWLAQADAGLAGQLAELGRDLTTGEAELELVKAALDTLPAEEQVQAVLQQIKALNHELGALETRQEDQKALVKQLSDRRDALDAEEKTLSTRLMRGDDQGRRLDLAGRAEQALARYEEALRRRRLGELEDTIAECFGRLSRKGRYIRRVTIDPASFATTLYNAKGDPLPREQLSAGEKQIYAVAVLWALRLVSGRSLPIIIDTPLGRLDSDHRRSLVRHYFPHASHQVILLSTDTEIDAELFADLAPAIAHSYQLSYRPGEAGSQIEPGYFWQHTPAEVNP